MCVRVNRGLMLSLRVLAARAHLQRLHLVSQRPAALDLLAQLEQRAQLRRVVRVAHVARRVHAQQLPAVRRPFRAG